MKKKKFELSMSDIVLAAIIAFVLGKYFGWW